MASEQTIAIVGATGAVGQTTLKLLHERNFAVRELRVMASERSVGKTVRFGEQKLRIEKLTAGSFKGVDFALFSAGAQQSREFAPIAVKAGVIACPNCTTIVAVMPLKPLHDVGRLRRVAVTSFQAVSGAGVKGDEELRAQPAAWARGEKFEPRIFEHQIAFNVIPHIDKFVEGGYTVEEMKLVNE